MVCELRSHRASAHEQALRRTIDEAGYAFLLGARMRGSSTWTCPSVRPPRGLRRALLLRVLRPRSEQRERHDATTRHEDGSPSATCIVCRRAKGGPRTSRRCGARSRTRGTPSSRAGGCAGSSTWTRPSVPRPTRSSTRCSATCPDAAVGARSLASNDDMTTSVPGGRGMNGTEVRSGRRHLLRCWRSCSLTRQLSAWAAALFGPRKTASFRRSPDRQRRWTM